jgi:hypothetical protein
MEEFAVIRFTQEQARALTGASSEAIRHWRKAVPYLAAKPGKSARFTFPDIVGMAVTNEVTTTFGVRVRNVAAGIDALFELLAETRPTLLEDALAVVTAGEATLVPAGEFTRQRLDGPGLVVPLGPLVARLRRHVLPIPPASEQPHLPFPPQVIRSGG